jgi:Multicopper oxidase
MVLGGSYSQMVTTLVGSLSQVVTNGNSMLGTQNASQYPAYLTNNPMPNGYPWGTRTARESNPYMECPQTGVTRYYNWTVGSATLAPDGFCISSFSPAYILAHEMLVINGAYPGPTIEANWGDWIEVTVTNTLSEGTALHWHGLLQQNTV